MANQLAREQIATSSLNELAQLSSSKFIIKNESGRDELRNDAKRNIKFNSALLFEGDEDRIDQASQTELEEEIANSLALNWDTPGVKELVKHIAANYTQGIIFPALAVGTFALLASDGQVVISDKQSGKFSAEGYTCNFYFDERSDAIFLEIEFPNYWIMYDGKITEQFSVAGSRWLYKLIDDGFEFVSADIENDQIYNLFLGNKPPESAEAFKEPVQVARSTIRDQIANAFHDVYNVNNASRTNLRAFLGITDFSWDAYNEKFDAVEKYSLGVLLSIPKNIVKLVTEFLPQAIENTSLVLMQRIRDRFDNIAARVLLQAVPAAVLAVSWTYRQFARRLTSPAQSCKDAYNFGARYNRGLGVILAAASAVVTVATFAAAGYGAAIGLAAAGAPFLAKAAIWEVSETASVGSFLTALGTKAAALVGVTLSPFAASVLSGAAITAVVTAGVVFIRDRFKAALHWKASNDMRLTHDAREIARPEQDKREAARLAAYTQRGETQETSHRVDLTPPTTPRRAISTTEQKFSSTVGRGFWDESSDDDDDDDHQFESKYNDEEEVKEEKTPHTPRKPSTPL